ncbi:MAG: MFS transporter [Chloroflexi bacterium]|nr:MFS transporter [Chloroflexota bacterium]
MNEYIALLRQNRNYRYLWLGNVVSLLGDWFNLIASAELVTDLSNTGVAISSLFLARFLPLFFVSPLAGVLADRYSRRAIMIASDVLRALTVLGFLLIRSPQHIWFLYALTILQFVLSALFTPARSAIIANVVPQKDLVTANALDSFIWSSMLALGAFLGGLATAVFGARIAFILDAMTFLLSAWWISRILVPAKQAAVSDGGGWFDFVDGLRYLWSVPFILGISLVKAAGSLVWGSINVVEVTFANEIFPLNAPILQETLRIGDGGTAALGVIYMVSGLGTGLGPLLMRRWLGDAKTRLLWGITIGFALMGSGIAGLGLATTFSLFLLATFIRTVGTGTLWVFSAALLQMFVPDRYRGRVFAFEFAALTLTQSISVMGAGFSQDNLGLPLPTIALRVGLSGLGVGLVWVLFHWFHLSGSKRRRVEIGD